MGRCITIRIGVDLDETINDMTAQIIPLYNAKYNDNIKYEDITEYDMRPFLKPECKHIWEEFVNDEFYAGLNVAPHAVDVLTELNKKHEIFFVTAGHPYTLRARDNWLERHFPFYKSSNLIVCREKQMLKLDFMIDDYENNLIEGSAYGLLIDKPWNRKATTRIYRIKRIFGLEEVPKIIRDFEKRC